MVRSGLCYKISLIFSLSPVFDTTSPGVRAASGDRAGARHGTLTPPRISPSCPHCLCLWLGRSIITRLLTRVGPVFENQSQCETARHRLFCGRMGPLCTFLAVFDAGLARTGGLGASSSVASAPSREPLVNGRIPVAGYSLLEKGEPFNDPLTIPAVNSGSL